MHAPTSLITLALAVSASALARPDAAAPASPAITPAPLLARGIVDQCINAAHSIQDQFLPSIDPGLASWLNSNTGHRSLTSAVAADKTVGDVGGVCSAMLSQATPPDSLTSAFSSHSSAKSSWHARMAPTMSSVVAECTGDALLLGAAVEILAATDVAQCTNGVNKYNRAIVSSSANAGTSSHVAAIAAVAGLAAALALF
ncbi:hypothetical protein C8A00DRAFT_18675 [Chaetomidium leptoderma]|uniref:Infection structure specific protein n=1 Tax=Chaetomidium leptoderma TaxID=669021 RepID=A0AAN6VEL7_9PEZI|nr:hypothetical protein C8A00DRAFT_18675 [Chaetomidium leptoderma]